MGRRILFVDDVRDFQDLKEGDTLVTARTSEEALAHLTDYRYPPFDWIWLDFDLGGVFGQLDLYDTAMPIALLLAELAFYGKPYPCDTIFIHTMNPVGQQAMTLLLDRFGYNVITTESF